MWSCQHSLSRKTHVTGSRSEISLYLKLGIRDFTAQLGRVLGLKVRAEEVRCKK